MIQIELWGGTFGFLPPPLEFRIPQNSSGRSRFTLRPSPPVRKFLDVTGSADLWIILSILAMQEIRTVL
jgi:hypothetical protein